MSKPVKPIYKTLAWDASAGAVKYTVYEWLAGVWIAIGDSSTTSRLISVPTIGTHYYAVTATNAQGLESLRSEPFAYTRPK